MSEPAESASLTGRVVRGAGFTAAGYLVTQAATLAAYAILARLATPTEFGTFTAAAILVTAGLFFAESGMGSAVVRWPGEIDAVAATALVSTLVGGVVLTLLSLALSPLVGIFFRSSEIGTLAAVLSGMFFVHAAAVVPSALLRRRFSIRPVLLVEPLAAATLGIAGGVALAAGLGVWGLAIGAYASAAVRSVFMWAAGGWRPRYRGASIEIWKELTRYARHIVAGETVRQTTTIVTTALTGRVLGPAPLGQFRYGYRMAVSGAGLTGAGAYVLLPTFSRLASDRERLRSAYVRALHVAAVVLFPLGLLAAALGEPLAVFLFGEPWAEAGWVFTALAGLMIVSGPGSVAAEFLKATGRPGILAQAHVLTAVVSISLVAVFVSVGGPILVGAAITLGAVAGTLYIVVRAASLVSASRRSVFGSMAAPFFCGVFAAAVVFVLDRVVLDTKGTNGLRSFVLLAMELALGLVCYLGVLIAVSPRTLGELRAVRDSVLSRRRRP